MRKILAIILTSSVGMFAFASGETFPHTPEQIRKRIAEIEALSNTDDLNLKTLEETMGTFTTGRDNPFKELIEENTKSQQATESRGYQYGTWTYWHDNGQIRSQGQFVDDKWSGKWSIWYKNGEKKSEGHYVNGIQEGPWVYWHNNGVKQSEGNYIKGKKSGRWIFWYKNGQKSSEGNYN